MHLAVTVHMMMAQMLSAVMVTVSVKNVYAQGGCSSIPKTGSTAGKAIADGVTLAKTSNRTLLNGKEIKDKLWNNF